ncbi:MAG TPA: acetyl-CoA carboxylase biotin carboxyl carrier protein [Acidobacteriota bacterium]|nr:acetyl-CoA carboxylase biotin carboxyl carrier protein [Acidobacteriota bacterium]HNT18101.1 acetyl-CoA carboxylase biotin carboxyl carrier protein [Acidobacteriota bacterium]
MVDPKKGKQTSLNLDEIKKLIEILEKSKLEELDVSYGDVHLRLSKTPAPQAQVQAAPQVMVHAAAPQAAQSSLQQAQPQANAPAGYEIKSPMVGTFYRSPAPNAEPFIKIGDPVKKGQTLCIIEAMKLMNEIECEVDGRVAAIRIQNAEPVEYGEVLMIIDTGA